MRPSAEAAFLSRVQVDGPIPSFAPHLGRCCIWTGAMRRKGYGHFRGASVHRVSYEMFVGPIPEGLDLDHLCRVPACVRPSHLDPVTRSVNQSRGLKSGLKTHCGAGRHLWIPQNIYVCKNGDRRCLLCGRENSLAAYYRRKKEAAR